MALTKIPSSLLAGVDLGDSVRVNIGSDNDLALFHTGSNGVIHNTTGALRIRANTLNIQDYTNEDAMITANSDGSVDLYHNNVKKFETSAAGATVTGTLTVTGDLDITGNVNSYNVTDLDVTDQTITLGAGQTEANSGGSGIIIDGSSASLLWNETDGQFDFNKSINVTGSGAFGGTSSYTSDGKVHVIDKIGLGSASNLNPGLNRWSLRARAGGVDGSFDIFDARNSASRLLIDSSGNVGIGVTPSTWDGSMTALQLDTGSIYVNNAGSTYIAANFYYDTTSNTNKYIENGYAAAHGLTNGRHEFYVAGSGTAGNDVSFTEAMRIHSDGKVGIGSDVVSGPVMGLHVGDGTGVLFGPSTGASMYISPNHENTINGGYGYDNDSADLWVNYRGYQNGTTRFRTFRVGDGKESLIAKFEGSTGNLALNGITDTSNYWGQADNLVLGGTGNDGITIVSSSNGNGRIAFVDTTSGNPGLDSGGLISYNHVDDELHFSTIDTKRLKISSTGKISTASANNYGDIGNGGLHLYGAAETTLDIDGSFGSQAIRFNDNGSLRAIMGFTNGSTIATTNVADGDFVLRAETGYKILFSNSGSPGFGMDTNGTLLANLRGTSDTTARIGIKIRGGSSSIDAEGGSGGTTNTFETNMNRQILLQYHGGSDMYAHAIHSRHNSGLRGGNTIDFYIHDGAVQSSTDLPNKRAFSIHNKAIELVPITTTERDTFGTNNYTYNGMMLYNETEGKFQGRANGSWVNLKTEDDYPVTSGLYYRYTADSFTYNGTTTPPTWNDTSGNNRNVSTTSTSNGGGFWGRSSSSSGWPTLETNSSNTNGANNEFKAVRFTEDQGFALPDDSNIASGGTAFSFAYVARYYDAPRKRIIQGKGDNNLIGFWDASRGVFYDGSWLEGPSTKHSTDQDDWCIIVMRSTALTSKTKDNNSGNFVEKTTSTHNYTTASYSATGYRYGINAGDYADSPLGTLTTEQSACEIAEIAFWNRNLTDAEIDSVQSFLETKYGI